MKGFLRVTSCPSWLKVFLPAVLVPSVDQFQRELNLARIARRLADDAEAAAADDVRRYAKIHGVEHVEEFSAKFHRPEFCVSAMAEWSIFHHREIDIVKTRSAEGIAPQRAQPPVIRSRSRPLH